MQQNICLGFLEKGAKLEQKRVSNLICGWSFLSFTNIRSERKPFCSLFELDFYTPPLLFSLLQSFLWTRRSSPSRRPCWGTAKTTRLCLGLCPSWPKWRKRSTSCTRTRPTPTSTSSQSCWATTSGWSPPSRYDLRQKSGVVTAWSLGVKLLVYLWVKVWPE